MEQLPIPKDNDEIVQHNRYAWNLQSEEGCRWSTPFSQERIAKAAKGEWAVSLTPNREVPRDWFPVDLAGCRVLCLASGGGQQAPLLAAAGAEVTSFDASEVQLQKDADTAAEAELELRAEHGDMTDLARFEDGAFDLIFHPVSNVFAQEIRPIWKECARVLAPGGALLSGFMNPCFFLFDHDDLEEGGDLKLAHKLPYSDLQHLPKETLQRRLDAELSLEFGHSLEDQIGGQLDAGLVVTGFYEDDWDEESTHLNSWFPLFMATRAMKLAV